MVQWSLLIDAKPDLKGWTFRRNGFVLYNGMGSVSFRYVAKHFCNMTN